MYQEQSQKYVRDGQKLIHTGHFDAATIKYKMNKLTEMFSSFQLRLEHRTKVLNQTLMFFMGVQPALGRMIVKYLIENFVKSKKSLIFDALIAYFYFIVLKPHPFFRNSTALITLVYVLCKWWVEKSSSFICVLVIRCVRIPWICLLWKSSSMI